MLCIGLLLDDLRKSYMYMYNTKYSDGYDVMEYRGSTCMYKSVCFTHPICVISTRFMY